MEKTVKRVLALLVLMAMLGVVALAFTSCGCDNDGSFKLTINEQGAGRVSYSFCVPGSGELSDGNSATKQAECYKAATNTAADIDARAAIIAAAVRGYFTAQGGWVRDTAAEAAHTAEGNGIPLDYYYDFTSLADLNAKLGGLNTLTGSAATVPDGFAAFQNITLTKNIINYDLGITLVSMMAPIWGVGQKLVQDEYILHGSSSANPEYNNDRGIFAVHTFELTLVASNDSTRKSTYSGINKTGNNDDIANVRHEGSKWNLTGAGTYSTVAVTTGTSKSDTYKLGLTVATGDFSAERIALGTKISEAKAISNSTGTYTAASFATLQTAITAGETELAKDDASTSAAALSACTTDITSKISGLVYINLAAAGSGTVASSSMLRPAGSTNNSNRPNTAASLNDGVKNTNEWEGAYTIYDGLWNITPDQSPCYAMLTFPTWTSYDKIVITWLNGNRRGNAGVTDGYYVETSNDGYTWTKLPKTGGAFTFTENTGVTTVTASAIQGCKYLRVATTRVGNFNNLAIYEIEVFNDSALTATEPTRDAAQIAKDAALAELDSILTLKVRNIVYQTLASTNPKYYRADMAAIASAQYNEGKAIIADPSTKTTAEINTFIAKLKAVNGADYIADHIYDGDLAFKKNVIKATTATASFTGGNINVTNHDAYNKIDGGDANSAADEGFIVDLGSVQKFDTLYLKLERGTTNYTIAVSDTCAAGSWTTVKTGTDADFVSVPTGTAGQQVAFLPFALTSARYIRFNSSARNFTASQGGLAMTVIVRDLQVYNESGRVNLLGAQKRANATTVGAYDMRFVTDIIAPNFDINRTNSKIEEIGTFMIKQTDLDTLGGGNITKEMLTANPTLVKDVKTAYLYNSDVATTNSYRFYNTIVGISGAKLDTVYVARSYMKVDGVYYYSNQVARSANQLP